MQSRFGIKDFITLALLAAVLISVWLSMQQKTRIEVSLRDMKEQVAQVGTQVSRVDAAAALLASDRGGFFVGATLDLNGGLLMR